MSESGERQVRMGVIGVGGMGQNHCKSIARVSETRLTAVCDNDEATARKVGEEHQVSWFTDYRQMIAAKVCDAVIIATPHPVRPPIVEAAARAGLHVLSEKPLCERVSGADRMIRAVHKAGVAFGVMFQRRTEPAVRKAQELVQSGAVGRIYRTTLISPEYRSQAYYDSAGWRATWVGEGGGVMMNQAPHILDLFVFLCGMPTEVVGRVETRLHRIQVEDHAEALLRYPDGGTGYLYCSTCEAGPGQMIEIFGDRGKLLFRNGELRFWTFETPIEEFTRTNTAMWGAPKAIEQPLSIDPSEHGHHVIIRNFARHILHGETLLAPGEEGLRSLELANAIWLSSHLRKPIRLPLSRRAYDAFLAQMRKRFPSAKSEVDAQRVTDPRFSSP